MTDSKQVIWDIERCISYVPDACRDCSKYKIDGAFCMETLMADALAIIREKEKPDCEHAEWDGAGCLGYCGCTEDDEPIEACKRCRKYTGNIGGENTDA